MIHFLHWTVTYDEVLQAAVALAFFCVLPALAAISGYEDRKDRERGVIPWYGDHC